VSEEVFDGLTVTPLRRTMTLTLNRRSVLGGLIALPACQASGSKFDAEVIIIGAGLAGLRAAQLLSAAGKNVLVLEGGEDVGGRVKTFDYGTLGQIEAGGAEIGSGDTRLLTLTQELGLSLAPKSNTPRQTAYFYDGNLYSDDAWKGLDTGLFPNPFKQAAPTRPLIDLARRANPLKSNTDWQNPLFQSYDISAQDFLLGAGFTGDAQKLIEQAFDGNALRDFSMMTLYRELQLRSGQTVQLIKNGAQSLPRAMAKTLPRKVITGQTIRAITVEAEKTVIETDGGKTFTAQHCLCALPFGALRNIAIKAFMPAAQSDAIRDLPQTQMLLMHVKTETPFWEVDGLPADMWTDLPLERVVAHRGEDGAPTGLFQILINGRGARRSVWENRAKLEAPLKAYLKTVRPASGGDFVLLAVQDWTRNNPLAGGAYAHWSPGQIGKWAAEMGQQTPRLIFAGGHLSPTHIGMEGALHSAERAADYIVTLPR